MPGAEFILCIIEITQTEIESAAGFFIFFFIIKFFLKPMIFLFLLKQEQGVEVVPLSISSSSLWIQILKNQMI